MLSLLLKFLNVAIFSSERHPPVYVFGCVVPMARSDELLKDAFNGRAPVTQLPASARFASYSLSCVPSAVTVTTCVPPFAGMVYGAGGVRVYAAASAPVNPYVVSVRGALPSLRI